MLPIGFDVLTNTFYKILSSDFRDMAIQSSKKWTKTRPEYKPDMKTVDQIFYMRPKPFSKWGEYE